MSFGQTLQGLKVCSILTNLSHASPLTLLMASIARLRLFATCVIGCIEIVYQARQLSMLYAVQ